jgi:hypothetical protein
MVKYEASARLGAREGTVPAQVDEHTLEMHRLVQLALEAAPKLKGGNIGIW